MSRNSEKIEVVCFSAKSPAGKERDLHFHSAMEIYCVMKGAAFFRVSGDKKLLTQGQMVIIHPFENHSCEAIAEAQVQVIRIGIEYLDSFFSAYPDNKLPRWLTDARINRTIWEYIEENFPQTQDGISELRKNGVTDQLLSTVMESYGPVEQESLSVRDMVLIAEIVQYIYDHCSENITLESLSKVFYLSPSILSKKLRKRICVDFRIFVNDIRIHKAIRLLDAPENREKRIEDIAILCGFSSMSTFYRCYKRNYGFRRMRGAEENVEQ